MTVANPFGGASPTRRLALRALSGAAGLIGALAGLEPARAMMPPPPPAPPGEGAFEAMDTLSGFLGAWEGLEKLETYTELGYRGVLVYLQFIRLRDYIAMIEFRNDSFSKLNLIVWNRSQKRFDLLEPGAPDRPDGSTEQVTVAVDRPERSTLVWHEQVGAGDDAMTRLSLGAGSLRLKTQLTTREGRVFPGAGELRRTDKQRWAPPRMPRERG